MDAIVPVTHGCCWPVPHRVLDCCGSAGAGSPAAFSDRAGCHGDGQSEPVAQSLAGDRHPRPRYPLATDLRSAHSAAGRAALGCSRDDRRHHDRHACRLFRRLDRRCHQPYLGHHSRLSRSRALRHPDRQYWSVDPQHHHRDDDCLALRVSAASHAVSCSV